MSIWFIENETPGYKLQWKVNKVLFQKQTRYQHVEVYDVIIVDSPDPVGPAVKLFEYPFYNECFRALKQDGILNIQSESPFFNQDIIKKVTKILNGLFKHVDTYIACIPTYPSGLWSFTMASKVYRYSDAQLERASAVDTRYFARDIFRSCFILPEFMHNFLNE